VEGQWLSLEREVDGDAATAGDDADQLGRRSECRSRSCSRPTPEIPRPRPAYWAPRGVGAGRRAAAAARARAVTAPMCGAPPRSPIVRTSIARSPPYLDSLRSPAAAQRCPSRCPRPCDATGLAWSARQPFSPADSLARRGRSAPRRTRPPAAGRRARVRRTPRSAAGCATQPVAAVLVARPSRQAARRSRRPNR
jgi:hypothetical protein